METITRSDFEKVELRTGTIIHAEAFPEAKKPAYKLTIDFWTEIGIKKSSAQITTHYTPENLISKQIIGVVNFPPKQIWPFLSECLVTGLHDENGGIVLISPDQKVANGEKLC